MNISVVKPVRTKYRCMGEQGRGQYPAPTKEVKSTTGKLPVPSIIDIRAAAWEEAEKAKNIAV